MVEGELLQAVLKASRMHNHGCMADQPANPAFSYGLFCRCLGPDVQEGNYERACQILQRFRALAGHKARTEKTRLSEMTEVKNRLEENDNSVVIC